MTETAKDCIFCRIAAKEIPSKLVFEDDRVVAFEDIQPQAPGHFLLVPKRHIARPRDLQEQDEALAGHILRVAGEIARKKGLGSYRLVANDGEEAGQVVQHVHFHMLAGRPMGWPPG